MAHLTAHGLLELVLDEGSFESWDSPSITPTSIRNIAKRSRQPSAPAPTSQ